MKPSTHSHFHDLMAEWERCELEAAVSANEPLDDPFEGATPLPIDDSFEMPSRCYRIYG